VASEMKQLGWLLALNEEEGEEGEEDEVQIQ
jgi:hypothetical protein